jgi:hypothetical protein
MFAMRFFYIPVGRKPERMIDNRYIGPCVEW